MALLSVVFAAGRVLTQFSLNGSPMELSEIWPRMVTRNAKRNRDSFSMACRIGGLHPRAIPNQLLKTSPTTKGGLCFDRAS